MFYITGDTHRDFDRVRRFTEDNKTTVDDVIIILGDAAINYFLSDRDKYIKEDIAQLSITLFCIHGNHEERPELIEGYVEKDWNGGTVYWQEEYPNLIFAKDGEVYDLGGNTAVVLGGAYSVDKYYRLINGYRWFESEQPNKETKTRVEANLEMHGWKVDYVFSHTAPLKYEPVEYFLPSIDQSRVDKSTEEWLDAIEERLDYKKWYLGHYHCEKRIDRIRIMFNEIEELSFSAEVRRFLTRGEG